jgi:hypothetical protein
LSTIPLVIYLLNSLIVTVFDEFVDITRTVLYREGVSPANSDVIADVVWNQMKSANIRDCVKIGRLARSPNDIDKLVNIFSKYKPARIGL